MKIIFFITCCILICSKADAQIPELKISKVFADTNTISMTKPDSGQFVRTYPKKFIDKDTIEKKSVVADAYYDTLVMIIEACPTCIFEIGSHTESLGPDKKNVTTSKQRANNIANLLIGVCGINKAQLRTKGYGDTKLLNKCDDGIPCSILENEINRRIELKIVGFIKQ